MESRNLNLKNRKKANEIYNFLRDLLESESFDKEELQRGSIDYAAIIIADELKPSELGFFAYAPFEIPCDYILRFRKELFKEFGLEILTTEEAFVRFIENMHKKTS